MADKIIKAIGYIRVSIEEQAREGYSLDNQRQDIEKYCKFQGWKLLDIEKDGGISGATIEARKGIKAVLKRIKDEHIDYLIVWKLSRLSRRMTDIVNIASFLENRKTYLFTIKDNIDTSTHMGKSFLYFAGIFAELERESMIVQVKGGMEQKAREGKPNGAPPLGYNLIDDKYVVDEESAKTVKLIFQEYLKGNGYTYIADLVNSNGYKTKKGNSFDVNAIKYILKNPIYKGTYRWGNQKDWGKKDENGHRTRVYSEAPIVVENAHEAIIEPRLFEMVQERMAANPRHGVKRFQGYHLLSGLLRCPECGYGMSYQPKTGKDYGYYICNQYQNKKQCKPNAIRDDKIEEEFYSVLDKIISDKEFQTIMADSINNSDSQINEIENSINRKNKEIKHLEKEQLALFEELLSGSENYKNLVRTKIEENIMKIEDVKALVDTEEKKIRELKTNALNTQEITDIIEKTAKVLKLLDKESQQRLVRTLVKSIHIECECIKKIEFSFLPNELGLSVVKRAVS